MSIQILSDDLIGKIAAGEVVERPASIVKELVENSIDAMAGEIVVDIEGGGKKRVTVIDDGIGMTRGDAKLSIKRHATSKILTERDLDDIKTMGFRGEALPSIAAVSKMVIETKPASGIEGFKILLSGGTVIEEGGLGCPTGTKIFVEDLFFNTPARKKFLRGDKTEEGHIIDMVSRLAMAFPNIRFKLTADGKAKLSCLSINDPRARIAEVFDQTLVDSTMQFEENGSGIKVSGFLGTPEIAGKAGIYLFVNKRFVRDRVLNHAVSDGYRSLLPNGSYPFAIVMLDIDSSRVDVNVHPTKQEVRFDNSGAVHNFVAMAVKKAVQKKQYKQASPVIARSETTKETISEITAGHLPIWKSPQLASVGYFSSLNTIGQLANSYIMCEGGDGNLTIIDQHAAHERIGFERLKKQLAEHKFEQQQLLFPEQIELPAKESAYITEYIKTLAGLGIEIEPFGGKTFIVKAIPALLSGSDIKSLILKIAAELCEIGKSSSVEELTEQLLKTIACHRQVRAGEKLLGAEMRTLLVEMDNWPNTDRCPHGRPTYIELKANEIAKWFKRT